MPPEVYPADRDRILGKDSHIRSMGPVMSFPFGGSCCPPLSFICAALSSSLPLSSRTGLAASLNEEESPSTWSLCDEAAASDDGCSADSFASRWATFLTANFNFSAAAVFDLDLMSKLLSNRTTSCHRCSSAPLTIKLDEQAIIDLPFEKR